MIYVRSVVRAATLFLIGILIGLALHVISPAPVVSSRNTSTVVVVSSPVADQSARSANSGVLR